MPCHLYGVPNLSYEWLDGTVTDVSGTSVARRNRRLWGEVGVGGNLLLGNRVTLFTEASANTAINDFGKSYSLKEPPASGSPSDDGGAL